MTSLDHATLDSAAFLATAGLGQKIGELKAQETFFCQGDAADSVSYLQEGRARLTVVSQNAQKPLIPFSGATLKAAVPAVPAGRRRRA